MTMVPLVLAPCRAAEPRPSDELLTHAIQVTGTSRVSVVPDRVSFTVGVATTHAAVAEAVEQNNARTRAVIEALVAAGVERTSVRTANLSVQPHYEHREGRTPSIVGYSVSNGVSASVDRTGDVGKLLQAAINAGANEVTQLVFTASKPGKVREEGLVAAFEDARAKAEALARAAGRRLGRALSIVEGVGQIPRPPVYAARAALMAEDAVSEIPTEPGMQELTLTVTVVFELD
jgi:hypothetical protein